MTTLLRNLTVTSCLVRGALHLRAFVVVLLLASAAPAFGGQTVGPRFGLHTEPTSPHAGQTFVLSLTAMTCHVFWTEDDPLGRVVDVEDNIITVTVDYTAPFNSVGCQSGTARDVEWIIGPFPQGEYAIRLIGYDPNTGFLGEGIDETNVIVGPAAFVSPSVIPTASSFGLACLAVMLLAGALLALRSRY